MEIFTVRDLRKRSSELIRCAKGGKLSVVTKDGTPLFIAVPFDEVLLREGSRVALALHLFNEEQISLSQAAQIAGYPADEMFTLLSRYDIPVNRTTSDGLTQQLTDPG